MFYKVDVVLSSEILTEVISIIFITLKKTEIKEYLWGKDESFRHTHTYL